MEWEAPFRISDIKSRLYFFFSDKLAVAALQVISTAVKEPTAFEWMFVNEDVSVDLIIIRKYRVKLRRISSTLFVWHKFLTALE